MPHDFHEANGAPAPEERGFTIQPFRADRRTRDRRKSNPPDLTATAFRCGSWSVRGPESDRWCNLTLGQRAVLVASVAAVGGLGLAGLAMPVLLVSWLLRALGAV